MMSINDRLTLKSTQESDFFIVLMSWEASGEPCSAPRPLRVPPPRASLLVFQMLQLHVHGGGVFSEHRGGLRLPFRSPPPPLLTAGHGLRAAGARAEAAGGGRDVPEHRPPPLPARTPQEAEFPRRRQQATQVRSPRLREGAFWRFFTGLQQGGRAANAQGDYWGWSREGIKIVVSEEAGESEPCLTLLCCVMTNKPE